MTAAQDASTKKAQTLVGAGIVLLALGLAGGAVSIPGGAGYGGVGPNFLPWVVAIVLAACGLFIVREALTGGFRHMDPQEQAGHGWWPGLAWISAALLANAALLTTIGFILSCALCYLLAVQGLRRAQGQSGVLSPGRLATDAFSGAAISAPVFWMFGQFLGISLPGLTSTGWI